MTITELKQGQNKLVELVQVSVRTACPLSSSPPTNPCTHTHTHTHSACAPPQNTPPWPRHHQSLHGELREIKAQQGQVVTIVARSSWVQRDQEAAATAAAPWEVGFGIAPPPPALKTRKPSRRPPSKASGYQQLEDEVTAEAGSSAKAGVAPGFTGEYAEVRRDAGRRFNSGRGVLPASHLLVSAGTSDPAKAFFKIGGFVLLGAERAASSHRPPQSVPDPNHPQP